MNNSSDNEKPVHNPSGNVPPDYTPLEKSNQTAEEVTSKDVHPTLIHSSDGMEHWSSGICACFDDIPSSVVGFFCPCYLFAKNAEFLGSDTFIGPCATHFILYYLMNTFCGFFGQGLIVVGVPGCFVSFYAFGYRKTLRSKYNLPELPCGDFLTHFFCHLCAICQEYREIRERSEGSVSLNLPTMAPPPVQKMDSSPAK